MPIASPESTLLQPGGKVDVRLRRPATDGTRVRSGQRARGLLAADRGDTARRVVGRHAPFLVVFLAGAVLRVVTFLAYQPGLAYAQDSFSYLHDAHTGVPNVIRPEGYAFFLRLVEGLTGQFFMVAVAQHAFGLVIGAALYLLLYRLGVGRWLAMLGAAPILLDSYQIYIEQFVLSETLFAFLAAVAAVILLWPSERWPEARVAAAGAILGLATVTRTVGIALIVGAVVLLVVRRSTWRSWLSFVMPVALILGGYGFWFRSAHGSFGLEQYHGYTLAARVSPFADCRGLSLPPDQEIFCDSRPPKERWGADVYLWAEVAPLRRRDGVPGPVRDRSAARFGSRIIRHQPLDYLRTVVGTFSRYFAPGDPVGPKDNSVKPLQFLTWYTEGPWHPEYPPSDPYNTNWTWPEGVKNQVIPARWGFDLKEQDVKVNEPLARRLRQYQQVGRVPGPLLALALLVAVVPALQRVGSARRRLRTGALFLAALGLLVLLLPSAIGTLDYRYRLPALVFLPAAGILGLALARGRVLKRRAVQARRFDVAGPQPLLGPRTRTSPPLEPSLFDLEGAEAELGGRSSES